MSRPAITKREKLLAALQAANGEPVTYFDLKKVVWGDTVSVDYPREGLAALVCQLKLRGHKIEVIYNVGYRLKAAVQAA